jgi:hypothetical protein
MRPRKRRVFEIRLWELREGQHQAEELKLREEKAREGN